MRSSREVTRRRREAQRGSAMLLTMIVLTALGTLSVLTVLTVRGAIQTTANNRFHLIALYAAESGGAAAIAHLRANASPTEKWSAFVDPVPANEAPVSYARFEPLITGNGKPPGDAENPFTADVQAYYEVSIYNNRNDTGLTLGNDTDARVVIRSTGYGPDGAIAIIEWEVTADPTFTSTPCQVYAQESQSEANSGTNNCIGAIDTSQGATFTP